MWEEFEAALMSWIGFWEGTTVSSRVGGGR